MSLSEKLRDEVQIFVNSPGMTAARLCSEAEVHPETVRRILAGEGVTLRTADKLWLAMARLGGGERYLDGPPARAAGRLGRLIAWLNPCKRLGRPGGSRCR